MFVKGRNKGRKVRGREGGKEKFCPEEKEIIG